MRNIFLLPMLLALLVYASSCGKNNAPSSNGSLIYHTGKDSTGAVLVADVDRDLLKDPARVLSCADCHGQDRNGRSDGIPDFGPYSAPAVTRDALLAGNARRPAYDAASLRMAITQGRNASGRALHYPMPRWKIEGKDLDDLVGFLLDR
jgi:hypothetical protein